MLDELINIKSPVFFKNFMRIGVETPEREKVNILGVNMEVPKVYIWTLYYN